ncbi:EAL domain-containing protein [Stenotrophomonas sp. SY1]|jgi:PAS domain S-box-containing protein|uniref:bifunctional diguanylate cyclase/phosphodiesterase n=1 Tax=Stenotrophomonas sp. SY1 TaxID=477235 RepID=UPI001E38DDF7|nr:EAL domain-containing protein [Stenotrophomonas sp. SY1]MCD9085744.1 EAL domain-containing protein [Stenotrophomonas sp. SY1]
MNRLPAHPLRVLVIAGTVVAVMLAVALTMMLWNDRSSRIEAAQRQSMALANGSDRLLRAQLITLERALRGTANDGREFYRRVPDQAVELLQANIRGVLERNHDLASITLVNGQGQPLSEGTGDPTLHSWVVAPNRVLSGELYIGPLEKLPGEHWVVRTAVPMQPDQWLLGRVRLGTFQEVVSGLDLGRDGAASIGNRFGQILAHSRDPGGLVGKQLTNPASIPPPSSKVLARGISASPVDNQLRISAISVPPDYPLTLFAALSYQEVMARWYVFLYAGIGIFVLYLIGFVCLLRGVARSAAHQQRMGEQLQAGAAELALAHEVGKVGTWSLHGSVPTLHWSGLTQQMLGLTGRASPLEVFLTRVHEDDRAWLRVMLERARQGKGALNAMFRLCMRDGSLRWLSARGDLVDSAGQSPRLAGAVVDISERVQTEARVVEAERQFRLVFDRNPAPFWIFDLVTLRFLEVNQAAVEQYGYSREEFLTMSILDVRPSEDWELLRNGVDDFANGGPALQLVRRHRRKDGSVFQAVAHVARLEFAGHDACLVLAEDVSQRLRYENELAYRASHHPGTGLLTARALSERLDGERGYTIIHVQLRGLQMIADTLGREAGEEALRSVAVRLGGLASRYGLLAHQPAEDFVLAVENPDDAQLALDALLEAVAEPVRGHDTFHQLEARVGVASCPADGDTAELVLGRAAQAAHAAREDGVPVARFTPAMAARYTERLQLAGRIHMAIDSDEFELHFQPIRHAADGTPAALEALLRWPQTDGSQIPPGDYIQLCEDTGLIIALGRWVLRAAAQAQRQLVAAGWDNLPIAVNVSAVQFFNTDLAGEFTRVLEEFGLRRGALQLELTESSLMRNPAQALQAMQRLHEKGISISLDDFGTGFSSMSYLQHLPLDSLKIDRSFVADVESNPRNAAICRALLSLGHSMGLSVIAEGVETEGQQRWLAAHGCDQVQGYLLGRPMALDELLMELALTRSME